LHWLLVSIKPYFDIVCRSGTNDPYMGIPRSMPSFSSKIHRDSTLISAVAPLVKETCSTVTVDFGENCSLTKVAIAFLRRFEPKGPSWYVNADVSSDETPYMVP
jgi:hypothetical protein